MIHCVVTIYFLLMAVGVIKKLVSYLINCFLWSYLHLLNKHGLSGLQEDFNQCVQVFADQVPFRDTLI